MDGDYIKVFRKLEKWEWYKCPPVKDLFIHFLIRANWKDGRFEGKEIKRGQFVTSIKHLTFETGLTNKQIRTAINKLKLSGEITTKTTNKYTVITIENYALYQDVSEEEGKERAKKGQRKGKERATIEEREEIKNKKEIDKEKVRALAFERNFSESIMNLLMAHVDVKMAKKKMWTTEQGMSVAFNQIDKAIKKHGEQKVVEQMEKAVEREWQGLNLDKIEDSNVINLHKDSGGMRFDF